MVRSQPRRHITYEQDCLLRVRSPLERQVDCTAAIELPPRKAVKKATREEKTVKKATREEKRREKKREKEREHERKVHGGTFG
jgi:hypothetical protein